MRLPLRLVVEGRDLENLFIAAIIVAVIARFLAVVVVVGRTGKQVIHGLQRTTFGFRVQVPNGLLVERVFDPRRQQRARLEFYKRQVRVAAGRGWTYGNADDIHGHEEEIYAAAEVGVSNGPYLRNEHAANGAAGCREIEATGSQGRGENLETTSEQL